MHARRRRLDLPRSGHMSSSGGGLQPTAILRRPPPGVELPRMGPVAGELPGRGDPSPATRGRVAAVLLVDNAAQPMQAASVAALRASRSPATPASCTSSSPTPTRSRAIPAGLQRPQAARPGVGRERAEVHRRRTGPGGGARPCADGSTRRASSSAVPRRGSRRSTPAGAASSVWTPTGTHLTCIVGGATPLGDGGMAQLIRRTSSSKMRPFFLGSPAQASAV